MLGVWLIFASGCAEASDSGSHEELEFSQRDSANISIVVTDGAQARRSIGWVVGATPDLEIGVLAGESPYQFDRVAGVTTLPDERIVVLDGGSRELRVYTPDGIFERAMGRAGEGPGEFRGAVLLPSFRSDTLVVYDPRLWRTTVFDSDGAIINVSPPHESTVLAPAEGATVGLTSLILSRGLLIFGASGRDIEIRPRPSPLLRIDLGSGAVDTIMVLPGMQQYTDSRGEVPAISYVPFDVWPALAAGPEGFVITEGEGPEIREHDGSGRLRRLIRVREAPRAVGQDEIERLARHVSRTAPEWRSWHLDLYRRLPIPEVMPTFQDLVVDAEGWIWAEAYRAPFDPTVEMGSTKWIVFDRTGQACGMMELPGGMEIQRIGWEYILGVREDELEVEFVSRYNLDRVGQSSKTACEG